MDKNSILLPAKFRKIGMALIITCVLLAIVFKVSKPSFDNSATIHSLISHILFGSINLGLFFTFYAKSTSDDEMTTQMKLKATMQSVLAVTLMFIIKPIIDVICGDPINFTVEFAIILLQTMQIMVYSQAKRKLKKELAYDEE